MVFMKKGGFIGSVDWKKFVNQSSLTDTESVENNFFHFEKQVEDTFHERQKKLIEKGVSFHALDITGLEWIEIDTKEDFDLARNMQKL